MAAIIIIRIVMKISDLTAEWCNGDGRKKVPKIGSHIIGQVCRQTRTCAISQDKLFDSHNSIGLRYRGAEKASQEISLLIDAGPDHPRDCTRVWSMLLCD